MKDKKSGGGRIQAGKFDGMGSAAELLRGLDEATRSRILAEMTEMEPKVAQELRDRMILLEDFFRLSDADLRLLVRAVPEAIVVLALRNFPAPWIEKMLSVLPERARASLQEEIRAQGPKPMSQVRGAQDKMIEIARELAKSGKIAFVKRP